ncbi:MAG: LPS translocon maturation chaperone LptM [Hyphomonas sp.]
MKRTLLLGAACLALSSVSACGLTGDLKRPAPMWGEGAQDVEPAELPDAGRSQLPQLPDREDPEEDTPPNAEDELLGGVGGSL